MSRNYKNAGWRSRQTYYKKQRNARKVKRSILRICILLPAFLLVVYAAVSGVINLFGTFSSKKSGPGTAIESKINATIPQQATVDSDKSVSGEALASKAPDVPEKQSTEESVKDKKETEPGLENKDANSSDVPVATVSASGMVKKDLYNALGQPKMVDFLSPTFEVKSANSSLNVQTTINKNLQTFLTESVQSVKDLRQGKPRYFGIVVMQPETGKILGMEGFDDTEDGKKACLGNLYPAASLFKIVTAAAAIETKGYNGNSIMLYHGNKYTLYKSQINDKRDRYSTKITLNDSFAQSINPVFGKLGSLYLNKDTLFSFGTALGFNKKFDFELPLEPSFLEISEDKFHQAEIASGYNRDTKISPIHGAMMASAVINSGKLPEPYLVEKVSDSNGNLLYQASPKQGEQVISPETADTLTSLMESTVSKGTGKKSFAGSDKDVVLKTLDMGGKTGSIDNPTHEVRFDWFIGFAKNDDGKKLALSIVVGHEKYIGTKASRYARMIFKRYFQGNNA